MGNLKYGKICLLIYNFITVIPQVDGILHDK